MVGWLGVGERPFFTRLKGHVVNSKSCVLDSKVYCRKLLKRDVEIGTISFVSIDSRRRRWEED